MARNFGQTGRVLLAATAVAFVLPAVLTPAAAQIGGFDTEIKKSKAKERVAKQEIVDVRLDASWKGPKSIGEALRIVKDNGEIVVHPGVYPPEAVRVPKSVTIRGIRDNRGQAPTLTAAGSCLTLSKDDVSVRVSDLVFRATDRTCITVSAGNLELENAEVRGKRAGYVTAAAMVGQGHLDPFNEDIVTGSRSALVSIRGGRVRITNTTLTGGETGVMINPGEANYAFNHVDISESTISRMSHAGVVMMGAADVTLASNTIVNNEMSGVVYAGSGHARLVGNIISNNLHNGLYVEGEGDAVSIERNKIHDNLGDGIEVRSGTAILVGNEIGLGDQQECMVNENAFEEGTLGHLAKPPINLLADTQGLSRYDTSNACRPKDDRRASRGRLRRR